MQEAIQNLRDLEPLPDWSAGNEVFAHYEVNIVRMTMPITDDEAEVLLCLFGPTERYDGHGMAWTLITAIETAPNFERLLAVAPDNWGTTLLRERLANKQRTNCT